MMKISDYYNGIVRQRRLNAPTMAEAQKDLARAYVPEVFLG
jgi:hypothetical protein